MKPRDSRKQLRIRLFRRQSKIVFVETSHLLATSGVVSMPRSEPIEAALESAGCSNVAFQWEHAMEDKRIAAIGPNPSGLCMCGCGRKTKIVAKSDRRHGHVMGQPFRYIHGHCRPALKGPNRFKLRRRTAVIFLERRDGTVLECLVSRKDFHRVRRHHWYANKNGKRASYAVAWIDGAQVQMHKHLCPNWAQVNHQNGNGLDNRRENLHGVRSEILPKALTRQVEFNL
jgi:hypothetical protein